MPAHLHESATTIMVYAYASIGNIVKNTLTVFSQYFRQSDKFHLDKWRTVCA